MASSGQGSTAVSASYDPFPVHDDVYECSNRVTLCGPTSQIHAMAVIAHFLGLHRDNLAPPRTGGGEHPFFPVFSGLPALAVVKTAAAAAFPREHVPKPQRAMLWYHLVLLTHETVHSSLNFPATGLC
ncbi:hypothetical protein BMF94_3101 [Rhodotorula taiwanensis]|uniref:Uncharacterized protein n=1 Tax=Rhodotorula taiwanensis TaxID=741276 RepID=A0A2S5BAN5_9BASI|nr:hypothetical protein BMF94_3101 [Rhodotorula taiwanensis]